MRHTVKALTVFSLLVYFFILCITKIDRVFEYRWVVYFAHLFLIATILLTVFRQHIHKTLLDKLFSNKEALCLSAIVLIALLISFLFIKNYPYVSVGDEVRDAGLNAQRVLNAQIKNFFSFGDYNGYGNTIPVIASFFYRLFGPSVLTYRFPAALLYVLEIGLFYVLIRLSFSRSIAFLGAFVYTVLPLHLFYARTELVVAFDSFWTVVILTVFYVWLHKRNAINYVFLGTILGVSSQFHTAVRVVAILVLIGAILSECIYKSKILKEKFTYIILLLIFYFVGFGPSILHSNSITFLQSQRYILNKTENQQVTTTAKLKVVKDTYMKSLMVWFYEPTTSRYPDHTPILPPFLALLFLLGIGYSIFHLRSRYFNFLLVLVFAIPFTNSAITDWVNADHRLTVLLPIGALFITLGIAWILQKARNSFLRGIIICGLLIYLSALLVGFFTSHVAANSRDIKDYLAMHVVYFLQSKILQTPNQGGRDICLVVSPANYQDLDLLHYKEQFQYFLPNQVITIQMAQDISDNEAYIFNGECPNNYKDVKLNLVTLCTEEKSFYCPTNYYGTIVIHY